MEDMEEKLGAILGNPQMMQQIMSLAQSLGQGDSQQRQSEPPKQEPPAERLPNIDPALLKRLAGMAGQNAIDNDQRALLKALGPYLSRERIGKLEKAMRAARIAAMASVFLSQGGVSFLTGR